MTITPQVKTLTIPWWVPWVVIIGAFIITTAALGTLYARAKRGERIAQANERAALDTTRVYQLLQGDSTVLALSRLLRQEEIDASVLADSLKGLLVALEDRDAKARAVTTLTVQLEALKARNLVLERDLIALARDSTPWRIVRVVDTNAVGIALDLYVSVPLDTLKAPDVEYADVSVPPIPVSYALGCSEAGDAVVALQGPAWATLTLRGGMVDPVVCHGRPRSFLSSLFAPSIGKLAWGAAGSAVGYGFCKLP